MTDATPESAISEERLAEIVETLRKRLSRASRNDRAYERPMTWDEADVVLALIDDLRARLAAAEGREVSLEKRRDYYRERMEAAESRATASEADAKAYAEAAKQQRLWKEEAEAEIERLKRLCLTLAEGAQAATARVAELEGALTDRARIVRLYCTHDKMTDAEKVGVLLHHPHFAVASVLSTQNIRQNAAKNGGK